MHPTNSSAKPYFAYFVLIVRFLLAWTFLRYGLSKLTGDQFGVTEADLMQPVSQLSLFKLSWYLFDHEPFKSFISVSQITCGFLLLFNRTVIVGALMFLPIAIGILIVDLTYMPAPLVSGFVWRLSSYILLDGLILWYHKERLEIIWKGIWANQRSQNLNIWAYLLLPLAAIVLEIALVLPKLIFEWLAHPVDTAGVINKLFRTLGDLIS